MNLYSRLHKLISCNKHNQYIYWSFISNIFISVECALSMHSMLNAINCNDDITRSANYIGKDILGQIGGLLYLTQNTKKYDEKPREILLHSNIIQQCSFFSMCLTPLVPNNYFLFIAGTSNVFSNIAAVGYGSINAQCIKNISKDNIGEIYAKTAYINTLGSSIGLILGLGISAYIPEHEYRIMLLPILAYGRIYTYNRAIYGLI